MDANSIIYGKFLFSHVKHLHVFLRHCSNSSGQVKLIRFLLADFPLLGQADHLAQVLLLQLTTFPVIITCRQSPKLSREKN